QRNAEPPRVAGVSLHDDRFVVQLLCAIKVAVQDSDVCENQQRGSMLCELAAGIGCLSRRDGVRYGLLVVAALKRKKSKNKRGDRDDPRVVDLTPQRQRLRGLVSNLDALAPKGT